MTSQLNVDTIVDKAGSGGSNVKMANTSTYINGSVTQNTVKGLNKAWHWSSEPGNLSDSFNVTSATDQGTGDNFITFTNNMSNATYPMPSAAQYNDISAMDESHIATNGFRHNTLTHAGSKNDSKHWAGILGDLA